MEILRILTGILKAIRVVFLLGVAMLLIVELNSMHRPPESWHAHASALLLFLFCPTAA